ncbi:hypothetical protein HNQ94_000961 [Salirhabdus euzebyi]|uniref:Uncharacterized protein n=1 Tax=Salirhabdus euzebyi TaxID=394506 RepID=A0A841PY50_9BACI|nr:hypothetical protein [Salirhabdus euzebyi]MBB6452516.1 hypothetical protein [Salirhabdus euzebyi]
MKKNKQIKLNVLLAAAFLIFFTLWILSEKDKKLYESYLSNELVKKIVLISDTPSYNLSILQNVLKTGTLEKVQAEELEMGFRVIAFETQAVTEIGRNVERLKDFKNDQVVSINADYAYFFMRSDTDEDGKKLTEEQISEIRKMEELMIAYSKVVNDTLKYTGEAETKGHSAKFSEFYLEKGITDDYWVDLLKAYEQVTTLNHRLR